MSAYPFRDIEKKWQAHWHNHGSFIMKGDGTKPKAYILEMFPYPSGKLHMGHVRNYAIGDVLARYKMLKGFDILHPMGWDAFGLPAENAAVKHKTSPATWTIENISAMRQQFQELGLSFDWSRELATCMPDYYGHEQKIFLDFYQRGIAYRKESWVNWDPVDGSVLANEQVINGRGWRSGAIVEKRKLLQWSLKITDYAQELLDYLPKLEGWPEKVIKMQENWIGRSEGALVKFPLTHADHEAIEIFTTRPETLFGASFCGLSPAHPLAEQWAANDSGLAAFIAECQQTPTTEEALSTAEKKGYNTGFTVNHPFIEGQKIPVFVANFVLIDYGTGAIFACPAHDERDYEFATKYHLPILPVIEPTNPQDVPPHAAYTGPGIIKNSNFLNGLSLEEARTRAISYLVEKNLGERRITYRLRDWCVSRQRYWGCPIPIIHCDDCGPVPVPLADLPVTLPTDVSFEQAGNPLDNHPTWKHVTCPQCQKKAVRETDTFDTFFESSWYFLRFCSLLNDHPFHKETTNRLMPVDWYIGGIEHAVLHLLYARFFTKALRDCGYIDIDEPFKNMITQGMVCHQTFQDETGEWLYPEEVEKNNQGGYVTVDGGRPVTLGRSEKMSKSKKNLVDPQAIIQTYGADSARLFVLSDTPPERDFEWTEDGVEGAWRYLNRLWRLCEQLPALKDRIGTADGSLKIRQFSHQTIVKFEQTLEKYSFNKAIAFARELTREIEDGINSQNISGAALYEATKILLLGLSPMIPHICSEIWEQLMDGEDLTQITWMTADPTLSQAQETTIAVQVNGKMRGSFTANIDCDQDFLVTEALKIPAVVRDLDERPIRRHIVIPNRIVNLVV